MLTRTRYSLHSRNSWYCQDLGVNRAGKSLVPSPADLCVGSSQREINGQMSPSSVPVCLLSIWNFLYMQNQACNLSAFSQEQEHELFKMVEQKFWVDKRNKRDLNAFPQILVIFSHILLPLKCQLFKKKKVFISGCVTYLCCMYTKMCLVLWAPVLADVTIPVLHIVFLSNKDNFWAP